MEKHRQYSLKKTVWIVIFFAVAMGYLEATVVVYLRELFYPEGFHFPLQFLPARLAWLEIGREASTITMLITLGMASGKTPWSRFSCFMLAFGVWDIFYYVWLKILIDWPSSLLEWDILFLIPVPWTGPVLAPVIVALSMICAAAIILWLEGRGRPFSVAGHELFFVILGAVAITGSFLWDFPMILRREVPAVFRWKIFWTGELLGLSFFLRTAMRNFRANRPES